jgi:hypothetical protein
MSAVPTSGRVGSRVTSFACAVLVCGCNATVEPIEVGAGCPQQPLRGPIGWESEPPERLIDDFEDGDKKIARVAGRNGSWILGSDQTSGELTDENSSLCAARGGRAGHFAGSGFESWGMNWTAVFLPADGSQAVGYDGSRYSAISFWAALGPNAKPPNTMPVGLTTLDNAWNSDRCGPCMDYYRTVIELTPAWQRVVVPFDELAQAGTGDPLVDLNPEELVGFIIWPQHEFDLWIDDVRFEE